MSFASGTILGPYRIVGPLGAGGMGQVYRARDSRLARDVALKTLPPEYARDPSFRQRFAQEARAVAALNHPNIVAMYDVGTQGDVAYMVTELVDGDPLRGSGLSLRRTIDLAVQVAHGLAAAHHAGVVHRDLKPSNILVTREGRAKILDFGLAKMQASQSVIAGADSGPTLTEPGVVMGTIGYMSPEQIRGGSIDHRSDIFSFGVILHELLSGNRTFQAETAAETMTAILKHDPPELPESVPPTVREIVAHCLEKDPANRFQSAKDLAFALAHSSTPSGKQPALAPPPARWRRVLLPMTAVLIVALSVFVGHFLWRMPAAAVWTGVTLGGPEVAYFPRPSPDGHLVAFVGNDSDDVMQVWVMRPGSRMMLSHDRSRGAVQTCSWSSDGNRIYYDRWFDQPKGVFSVPALGGDEQLVLEDAMMPEALPDGSLLLVRINPEHRYQVFRYWPDTGKLQGYGIEVSNFYSAIRAGPAGHRALILGTAIGAGAATGIHLFVVDLATGGVSQFPEETPGQFADASAGAAFSRDGKHALALSRKGNTFRIESIPLEGRDLAQTPPQTVLTLTQVVYSIDTGPDNSIYLDQSDRAKELLRFAPAGGKVERIASLSSEMGDDNFAVLRDGRAVWLEQAGGHRRLVLVEQGKDPVPLINTREETSWPMAPVGEDQVAFLLGRERQTVAVAALSNGRITRQIPLDKGPVGAMAAAPDGKTLYCAAAGTIWAVPVSGGVAQKIANGDSVAVDPASQSLMIEVLTPPNTRLVRVPLAGGAEQEVAGSFQLGLGIDPGSIAGGKLVAPMASPYWYDPPGLFNLATGEATRIPLDYRGDFHHMQWTPDGKIMAVAAGWRATLWKFSAGR
jgi:eukaryotic-like serine/threonine-protein kinase